LLLFLLRKLKIIGFVLQIFPNGSLSVHRLEETDQGDYTCGVQNAHGSDRIVYEIIVQGEILTVSPTGKFTSRASLSLSSAHRARVDRSQRHVRRAGAGLDGPALAKAARPRLHHQLST